MSYLEFLKFSVSVSYRTRIRTTYPGFIDLRYRKNKIYSYKIDIIGKVIITKKHNVKNILNKMMNYVTWNATSHDMINNTKVGLSGMICYNCCV